MSATPEKSTAQLSTDQRLAIIDEYGDLEAELARVKPKQLRRDELRKLILSWHASADAEALIEEAGHRYTLQIGARENERIVLSMPKLAKAIGGVKALYEICKVAIGDIDKRLSPSQQKGIVATTATGPRKIRAYPRVHPILSSHVG